MKKKMHKILAVALTLTLLVGLVFGLAAVPAAAGTLTWDKEAFPAAGFAGKYFRDSSITALGPMAMAIDGTLFAGVEVNVPVVAQKLYKSADGGRTWSATTYAGGTIVDIAVSTEDADALWVADNTYVYRSLNGGTTFTTLTATGLWGAPLNALAVGYVDNDPYIFVGDLGGEIFTLNPGYGTTWQPTGSNALGSALVLDIACSPNFNTEADPLLMAVTLGASGTELWYKYGGGTWNTKSPTLMPVTLITASGANTAQIGFPDDFAADPTSKSESYIAIDDGGAAFGGVYWVAYTAVIGGAGVAVQTGDFTSVDIAGDIGDVSLVAGTNAGAVWHSTDGHGLVWTVNQEAPSGSGSTYVVLAQDFLASDEAYALASGTNAAFSLTEDGGGTFNDISLIQTGLTSINDLAFAGTDRYLATTSTGFNDSLWRYDGTYWERIANAADIDFVTLSREYSSDDAIFWADATTPDVWRSTDAGDTFRTLPYPPNSVTSLLALDDSTVLVGNTGGGIEKTDNGGITWSVKPAGINDAISFAVSPNFDSDSTLLAGTDGGEVFKSTTAGNSWLDTGFGGAAASNAYPAFAPDYATSGKFYAAGAVATAGGLAGDTNDLLIKSFFGTSWTSLYSDAGLSGYSATTDLPDSNDATGLVVAPDGTLYVSDSVGTAPSGITGVLRSLNGFTWQQATSGILATLDALHLSTGSNVLLGYETTFVWTFTDTLTGKVTLSSPVDAGTSGRVTSATITWQAMPGAFTYEYIYDVDSGFKSGVGGAAVSTSLTTATLSNLDPGRTYFWKVRGISPLYTNWSSVWEFTTALGEGQWNPFQGGIPEAPTNGATNVSLTPTFAWNAADWATGYEFVLATDAAFSSTVVSKTGSNALTATVYLSEETLSYETTYYWKVRATSKTSNSEWATAVFTTMAQATVAPTTTPPTYPTPTVIVPEAEAETPMYIWVIIGVGAALVIAMIVLIVRTRRVV
jgi:hypothetical protein